jgi:uncharacterized protein (TIGR03435 family)
MRVSGLRRIVRASIAIGVAAVSVGVTVYTSGQPASEGRLQFQVASIKRNPAANTFFQIMPQRSGRFVATAATLRRLILFAYQVRDFQVVGGPKWLDADLWDVNAAGEPAGPEAVPDTGDLAWMNPSRLRLRTLLEDRFQLRVHTESREMPLFELRVSKDGSRLRRSDQSVRPAASANEGGAQTAQRGSISMTVGGGEIVGVAIPVSALVGTLSAVLGRIVTDHTGLQGLFDFTLTWAPDVGSSLTPRGPLPPGVELPPVDPTKPSLFTAVQEQLGLRLESIHGQAPVLVIDAALPATPE